MIAYTVHKIAVRYKFQKSAIEIAPLFEAILAGNLQDIFKLRDQLDDKLKDPHWRETVPMGQVDLLNNSTGREYRLGAFDFYLKLLNNLQKLSLNSKETVLDISEHGKFLRGSLGYEAKALQDFAGSHQTKKIEKLQSKNHVISTLLWHRLIGYMKEYNDADRFDIQGCSLRDLQSYLFHLNTHYPNEAYDKAFTQCKTKADYYHTAKIMDTELKCRLPLEIEYVYAHLLGPTSTAFSQPVEIDLATNKILSVINYENFEIVPHYFPTVDKNLYVYLVPKESKRPIESEKANITISKYDLSDCNSKNIFIYGFFNDGSNPSPRLIKEYKFS